MKRSIFILILILAACGHPSITVPVPLPSYPAGAATDGNPIDVFTLLFSTPCHNVGLATVCDSISGDIATRNTYTVGYMWQGVEVETHSVYGRDTARNCITNRQEETRNHATGALMAIQTYMDAGNNFPCWAVLNVPVEQLGQSLPTRTPNWRYTWDHIGPDGNPIGAQHASGTLTDSTVFDSFRLTLTEGYQDTTGLGDDTPYCRIGQYSLTSGMVSIKDSPGSCQ